jgi:hypothetical protein
MFPLLVIGLVSLRYKSSWLIMFFLLLAPLADSLTGEGHYGRSFLMVFPLIYFISFGTIYLLSLLYKKKMFLPTLTVLGFVVFLEFGSFYTNYLSFFPKMHSFYTHWEYQPLFEYLRGVEQDYKYIYISKVNHDQRQYIFYLYYFQVPAKEYFKLPKEYVVEDNGWIWVKSLGKFNFINQVERLDSYPPKSLLIIDPDGTKGLKGFNKIMTSIKYKNGDTAFNIYDLDKVKELIKLEDIQAMQKLLN